MIKVFLVEDEFVVREGIKKNIDWAGHGYEFCGDASDGEMAFPLILEAKPDIVITDIKMPFMDGIELSRLIKQKMPNVEIIILSGYEEFEYAKEGIKIGVAQYLTKPISGSDLLRELDKISAKILEKQSIKSISEFMAMAEKINTNALSEDSHKDDFSMTDIEHTQLNKEKVKEFLRVGDGLGVVEFVNDYIAELGEDAMQSVIFRQYIMMDIYFCVTEFLSSLSLSKDSIDTFDIKDNAYNSEDGSKQYIIKIIGRAIELRDTAAFSHHKNVVGDVIKYIDDNYADEELSLNVVADYVNFSPNHLSTVFSKETGQTFIKYLTDYRMRKAKELLKCTNKRSSEIGLEVGYKDPHYFSYLFKKTQGMTPTQYKGKGTDEE